MDFRTEIKLNNELSAIDYLPVLQKQFRQPKEYSHYNRH